MTDVFKLAEEALEPFESDGMDRSRDPRTMAIQQALTALRTARAEWGWKLLSDLGTANTGLVTVGRWLDGKWVTIEYNCYADIIVNLGYTHYAVPKLPPPPARWRRRGRDELRNAEQGA